MQYRNISAFHRFRTFGCFFFSLTIDHYLWHSIDTVIKPAPGVTLIQETRALQATLHAAATSVRQHAGIENSNEMVTLAFVSHISAVYSL